MLTAKDGSSITTVGTSSLESYSFTLTDDIPPVMIEDISYIIKEYNFKLFPKKASETTVTREEIESIGFNNEDIDLRKLSIIKKSFNLGNVTDQMIMNGLQIKKMPTKIAGAYTLVLIAKPGYTINR